MGSIKVSSMTENQNPFRGNFNLPKAYAASIQEQIFPITAKITRKKEFKKNFEYVTPETPFQPSI